MVASSKCNFLSLGRQELRHLNASGHAKAVNLRRGLKIRRLQQSCGSEALIWLGVRL